MYLLALAQLTNDLWIEEDGWEESEIGIGKRERQVGHFISSMSEFE